MVLFTVAYRYWYNGEDTQKNHCHQCTSLYESSECGN